MNPQLTKRRADYARVAGLSIKNSADFLMFAGDYRWK